MADGAQNLKEDILAAHKHCSRNRASLAQSDLAGCCYCCRMFPPAGICEWDDQTAMCPYCGIDSVVPSAAQFPMTAEFLQQMAGHWFSGPRRQHDWGPEFAPVLAEQPYPLLFVTISGAHLYGFHSGDSDFDLRGVHVLPLREVVGLRMGSETIEQSGHRQLPLGQARDGAEVLIERDLDLVSHDVLKFFKLLLRRNGYVLEQLLSPLIVHTTPEHEELKSISQACVTRHHAGHYLGFAETQWRLFEKERRIKPLLYTYRVLLTGIHLMRTGTVEANLRVLNDQARLSHVNDLIARKRNGCEDELFADRSTSAAGDFEFHASEYRRLTAELEAAREVSSLPLEPSGREALHDLLVRLRLRG